MSRARPLVHGKSDRVESTGFTATAPAVSSDEYYRFFGTWRSMRQTFASPVVEDGLNGLGQILERSITRFALPVGFRKLRAGGNEKLFAPFHDGAEFVFHAFKIRLFKRSGNVNVCS
jgi:hypothetical protein